MQSKQLIETGICMYYHTFKGIMYARAQEYALRSDPALMFKLIYYNGHSDTTVGSIYEVRITDATTNI